MSEALFQIFDAWEPLLKARKAKGLANWDKLKHLAERLEGKQSKHITFTCGHPSHTEPTTHTLGSVQGNTHFLMGYGNPGFHMASYHWQIIDPNLSDAEAEKLHKTNPHPARPELWNRRGLEMPDEGELDDGASHPELSGIRLDDKKAASKTTIKSGAGEYVVDPGEGLVHGKHNGHVYKWHLVEDSYFAATNPKVVEAMESFQSENTEKSRVLSEAPMALRHRCKPGVFSNTVYPLVKSLFPKPGSLLPLTDTHYGVVTNNAIEFYNKAAVPVSIRVYGRDYNSFDLEKGGDIHPDLLCSFASIYLGLDLSEFKSFNTDKLTSPYIENVVEGRPSPGYEDVPAAPVE